MKNIPEQKRESATLKHHRHDHHSFQLQVCRSDESYDRGCAMNVDVGVRMWICVSLHTCVCVHVCVGGGQQVVELSASV